MIDFFCCLFDGKKTTLPAYSGQVGYSPEWADKLFRAVSRHTNDFIRFVCLTDQEYQFQTAIEQIPCLDPGEQWGCIMETLNPEFGGNRRIVLGLDTLILGNIQEICDWPGDVGLLTDPYYPETICNGVGSYSPQACSRLYRSWTEGKEKNREQWSYKGQLSEMVFLRQEMAEATRLDQVFPDQIQSYKAHYRDHLETQDKARIVYFHGRPKMQELHGDDPLLRHWQ